MRSLSFFIPAYRVIPKNTYKLRSNTWLRFVQEYDDFQYWVFAHSGETLIVQDISVANALHSFTLSVSTVRSRLNNRLGSLISFRRLTLKTSQLRLSLWSMAKCTERNNTEMSQDELEFFWSRCNWYGDLRFVSKHFPTSY